MFFISALKGKFLLIINMWWLTFSCLDNCACMHTHVHVCIMVYLKNSKKLFQKTCMMFPLRCRRVFVGCTVCKCGLLFCYFHLSGEFTQYNGYWVIRSVQETSPDAVDIVLWLLRWNSTCSFYCPRNVQLACKSGVLILHWKSVGSIVTHREDRSVACHDTALADSGCSPYCILWHSRLIPVTWLQ